MTRFRKFNAHRRDSSFFHIDDDDCEIRNFYLCVNNLQLIQYLTITRRDFIRHETIIHIKILIEIVLFTDDQKRNFVFVDFVREIHDQNLIILLQNLLRTFANEKQINN
jgi:hypothetical protein